MKTNNKQLKERFTQKFYSWIYEDSLRNSNGDIDAPEMEKDLWDFFSKEIDSLLDGLKMKKRFSESSYGNFEDDYDVGYNQAVKEFNDKLKELYDTTK